MVRHHGVRCHGQNRKKTSSMALYRARDLRLFTNDNCHNFSQITNINLMGVKVADEAADSV